LECKTKFGKYFKRSQCLFIRFWSGVNGLSQASIAQPSVRLLPVDVLSKGSFIDKATRTQTQWANTHTHTRRVKSDNLTTYLAKEPNKKRGTKKRKKNAEKVRGHEIT